MYCYNLNKVMKILTEKEELNNIHFLLDMSLNPAGSIKFYSAQSMLMKAINQNNTLPFVTATSGNFGVAIAQLVAYHCPNIPIHIVCNDNVEEERLQIMKNYGAKVNQLHTRDVYAPEKNMLENYSNDFYHLDQYRDEYAVLGMETAARLCYNYEDEPAIFITGHGTGATITGFSKILKGYSCYTLESNDVSWDVAGLKCYKYTRPPVIYDDTNITDTLYYDDLDFVEYHKILLKHGILCGWSTVANISGMMQLEEMYENQTIISLLIDRNY